MTRRLDESVASMRREFPVFAYERAGTVGVWTARIKPVDSLRREAHLLADLHEDREILYDNTGRVLHSPACGGSHPTHAWMSKLPDDTTTFALRISYAGGHALPQCVITEPLVPRAQKPHTWRAEQPEDDFACAFFPRDVWDPKRGTVADLVPDFLVWVLKQAVFLATREWIGSQHQNSPEYHLQVLRPDDLCWCQRGRKYKNCCRGEDQKKLWTQRRTLRLRNAQSSRRSPR